MNTVKISFCCGDWCFPDYIVHTSPVTEFLAVHPFKLMPVCRGVPEYQQLRFGHRTLDQFFNFRFHLKLPGFKHNIIANCVITDNYGQQYDGYFLQDWRVKCKSKKNKAILILFRKLNRLKPSGFFLASPGCRAYLKFWSFVPPAVKTWKVLFRFNDAKPDFQV